MESSFITLFDKPRPDGREPPAALEGKNPRHIPMPFSLLFIPVMFIGAAISIPWSCVDNLVKGRREKRFAKEIQAASRSMTWKEFGSAMENEQGTIIGEYLSFKGPFRLWWTEEDIPAASPYKWEREDFAWYEPQFTPFFEWCYARFTNPQSGTARLVMVPAEERKGLREKLSGTRYVSICSFAKASGRPKEQ
jgi:hypothetical protein